jgi:DNA-binding transcriptional LysR family regulator
LAEAQGDGVNSQAEDAQHGDGQQISRPGRAEPGGCADAQQENSGDREAEEGEVRRAVGGERDADGGKRAGVVRITTVDALAVRFLAPSLPRFRDQLPDVTLEIDSSARSLDLGRREADLALRLIRPRQEALVARKVGRLGFRLYAARSYVERRGLPRVGHGLEGHDLIDDDEEQTWSSEVKWARVLAAGARVVARMQTWQGRMVAAEAGAGIAVLPCLLGDSSKVLRRLGRPGDTLHQDLWLLLHRELREVARIRVVFDFVATLAAQSSGRLEGSTDP